MIFRFCRSVDCTERGGKQVTGCIPSFMLPWKPQKRHIWPVSQTLSSVYFLLAKFQLVSCNLSLAIIWQMRYTHKLPKLCSATLSGGRIREGQVWHPATEMGADFLRAFLLSPLPSRVFRIKSVFTISANYYLGAGAHNSEQETFCAHATVSSQINLF